MGDVWGGDRCGARDFFFLSSPCSSVVPGPAPEFLANPHRIRPIRHFRLRPFAAAVVLAWPRKCAASAVAAFLDFFFEMSARKSGYGRRQTDLPVARR